MTRAAAAALINPVGVAIANRWCVFPQVGGSGSGLDGTADYSRPEYKRRSPVGGCVSLMYSCYPF